MKPLARRNKDGQIISFQLRVYVGRDENNRQSFETTTWIPDKKYTSAKKLLQAADRAQLNFEDQVKKKRKRLSEGKCSFQKFTELFMENHAKKHLAIKTYDEYSNMLKHLVPVFGEREFTEIPALEYEKFLGSLTEPGANKRDPTKGLSTKSVYNYRAFLSALYEKAILWKMAKENPIKSVERVKVKKKEIPVLTREETIKVFQLLDVDAPLRYNVFIRLALFTGMRRGEMCGLKWDYVDEKNCLITIKRSLLTTKSAGVILSDTKTEKSNRVM